MFLTHMITLTVFIFSSEAYLESCHVYFLPSVCFVCYLYIAYIVQGGVKGESGPSPIGLPGFIGEKGQEGG